MTVIKAIQDAAVVLIGQRPASAFGVDDTFAMEMTYLVNEVAEDIAQYQDWQTLTRVAEITSDGSSDYDLPSDYSRMLINSDVQNPAQWLWGYRAYTDINAFLFDQGAGYPGYPGGWIIYGDKLRFSPAPNGNAVFPYISKAWAKAGDGTPKTSFTDDMDAFVLSERLLTLGLIWRWRADIKKLDASGDQEAFVKALDEYGGKDAGSQIIRFGSRNPLGNRGRLAYTGIVRG